MIRALGAGICYAAIVFAAGFVAGTIRELVFVPWLGRMAGIVIELPLMLGVSWAACGWIIDRLARPLSFADRALMATSAFIALMSAELATAVLLFHQQAEAFFRSFADLAGALGLAGQIVFAGMALLRRPQASKS